MNGRVVTCHDRCRTTVRVSTGQLSSPCRDLSEGQRDLSLISVLSVLMLLFSRAGSFASTTGFWLALP
jgi:hypothetical protein